MNFHDWCIKHAGAIVLGTALAFLALDQLGKALWG
jgi:hypothetical protein